MGGFSFDDADAILAEHGTDATLGGAAARVIFLKNIHRYGDLGEILETRPQAHLRADVAVSQGDELVIEGSTYHMDRIASSDAFFQRWWLR